MKHEKAVCQNLFANKAKDHFHMLVYYSDGKFTDSNTNRVWSKMKEEKVVSWSSQQIIKQILSAFQRTAGRQSKYTFDMNAIVAAMSNVSGDQNDSYRESNSFWGEALVGRC